jgi:hypothetical protein
VDRGRVFADQALEKVTRIRPDATVAHAYSGKELAAVISPYKAGV